MLCAGPPEGPAIRAAAGCPTEVPTGLQMAWGMAMGMATMALGALLGMVLCSDKYSLLSGALISPSRSFSGSCSWLRAVEAPTGGAGCTGGQRAATLSCS